MSSVLDAQHPMLAAGKRAGTVPRTDAQIVALRDLESALARAAATGLLESLIQASDFSDSVGDVFDTVRRLSAARQPVACRLRIA